MQKSMENNLAFIDGQNLHLGTTQNNWRVDFEKFRVYLKDYRKEIICADISNIQNNLLVEL
jgi:hypothetical protein